MNKDKPVDHVKLPVNLYNAIASYITGKPFNEVEGLVIGLRNEAVPVYAVEAPAPGEKVFHDGGNEKTAPEPNPED